MTERSSFKIFVGVFPPKNIASVGNSITIYQTSVIEYYPTEILDNPQIINESYEQNDCENAILGCDENFIIPPPPDNCGGGTQGPPGPPGPQGPVGPAGTGSGGKTYCGSLPSATPPTPDTAINLQCLLNQRGYVCSISSNSQSCGININNPILTAGFYYRADPNNSPPGGVSYCYYDFSGGGSLYGGTTNLCANTTENPFPYPKLETAFRKISSNTYSQEWTFEQFLLMQGVNPQTASREQIKNTTRNWAPGNPQGPNRFPFIFVPNGSTWASGTTTAFGDWVNILGGDSSSETAQDIISQNPGCVPPAPPAPPLPTNQGGSICGGGQQSGSLPCGSCPQGSGLSDCSQVKAGDTFIDANNGVMYFATQNGSFATNGVPLGGGGSCNQPDGGDDCNCNGCIDGCGGGGGGGGPVSPEPTGPAVRVEGSEGSTATSSPTFVIQVKSGLNVDFGAISGGTQIQIAAHSKAIGYIKLIGYTWDPVNELWLYTGYPQIFMNGENFELSADTNWSTETLQVYNIAELDSTIKSIPLFAELNKINNIVYGFSLPKTAPLVSITYNSDRIVPLYHTKNQNGDVWFINQANSITSGTRLKAKITANTERFNSDLAIWKYTATFCKINYIPSIPSSVPFGNNIIPTPYLGESSCRVYNLWELANTPGTAYGYPINSTYNNTIGGFPLLSNTGFGIKAVPLNTVVDLEVDQNGNFYFNAINPIGGGC